MAETMFRGKGVQAQYRIAAASTRILEFLKIASQGRLGTIILTGSSPGIKGKDFLDLVAEIECSIFVGDSTLAAQSRLSSKLNQYQPGFIL